MNLLVTGGAGFIGSHFVLQAATFAERVTVLDALTYAGRNVPSALPPNVSFNIGNIRDPNHLIAVLRRNSITHIVHLAAETHVDRSIANAEPFVRTNVIGTANLLYACRAFPGQVKMLVYVSTDEVYGSRLIGKSMETDRLDPSSPYSATKAAGEMLCLAERVTFGLPIVITRGTNTYGPGQHVEKFVPTIITRILKREPVPIYGDGQQARDWMHVADHCYGITAALLRGTPGEIYNLGARNVLSNLSLVNLIAKTIEEQGGPKIHRIEHVTDRKGHDRRYAVDTGKAEQLLDWRALLAFDLTATVKSYMSQ